MSVTLGDKVYGLINQVQSDLPTYQNSRTNSGKVRSELNSLKAEVAASLKTSQLLIKRYEKEIQGASKLNPTPDFTVSRHNSTAKQSLQQAVYLTEATKQQFISTSQLELQKEQQIAQGKSQALKDIDETLGKLPYGYCELVTKTVQATSVALAAVAAYAVKSGAVQVAIPAALNYFSAGGNSTATIP